MDSFLAILHIVVALILISLVLVQDSKSGSVGGAFGGGGSSSILGATGAATLAQRLTRWTAVVFAVTSIGLSVLSARGQKSVVDSIPVTTAPVAPAPTTPTAPAAPSVPGATAPTAPVAPVTGSSSATPAPATGTH